MDRIHRIDLQPLLDRREGFCISLYMSCSVGGRDSREDEVRLRDLVSEAEKTLIDRGLRRIAAEELTAPVRSLPDDIDAWRRRGPGLAAFVSPGFVRVFNVAGNLQAAVLVDHQFHIRPLLGLMAEDDRFHVLAISQNSVRFFTGDAKALYEAPLAGAPKNLKEAIDIEGAEHGRRYHSGMAGEAGKRAALHHGQGGKPEAIKENLREFLRPVACAVDKALNGEQAPLVLATVEATVSLWREISRYKFLLDDYVAGSPDHLSASELHAKAWPIVEPALNRRQQLAWQRLQEAAGSKVSFGLEKIVPAAMRAQIDSLFIDPAQTRWGRYHLENESVEIHDQPQPGDEDLVQLAAVETLKHKGSVFTLQSSNAQRGQIAEALLRF